MKNKTNEINFEELSSQSGLSLDKMNVKKKSSAMRTTFRLTDQAIDSLHAMTEQSKIKDFFDRLGDFLKQKDVFTEFIVQKANDMEKTDLKHCKKKSFAISKKTIKVFNKLSKDYTVERDAFVNQSIIMFDTLTKFLREEDAKKVKIAQKEIKEFRGKAFQLEKEISELLGNDHEVTEGVGLIYSYIESFLYEIDEYLESGKPIELF